MAKITGVNLTNPLARTAPKSTEPMSSPTEKKKSNAPVGIYLSEIDRRQLDSIAKFHNLNRHQLLQYAVQNFLRDYGNEKITLETEQVAGKVVIKQS